MTRGGPDPKPGGILSARSPQPSFTPQLCICCCPCPRWTLGQCSLGDSSRERSVPRYLLAPLCRKVSRDPPPSAAPRVRRHTVPSLASGTAPPGAWPLSPHAGQDPLYRFDAGRAVQRRTQARHPGHLRNRIKIRTKCATVECCCPPGLPGWPGRALHHLALCTSAELSKKSR